MPESKKYHFNKKDIFSVGLVFLAALILRLIYFAQYSSVSFFPFLSYSDSEAYYSWARDILSGDVIGKAAFMKWPLYAYFLAGLFFIFGINALAVFSLQFVLGSINCVLVYLIGRLMFNRAVGLIAGLLCAFYGLFIFYDALLTYTTLSIFLNLILFLLFFLVRGRPAKGNFFWLGLYSGICAITQGSVLIFSIAAAFLILVFNKTGLKKFCLSFGFFIIGLGIIIGGVTLRNYFVEKDFVLLAGNTGFNFYSGNNPDTAGTFFCPKDIGFNQEDMFRDAKIFAEADLGRPLKPSEVSKYWFSKSLRFLIEEPAAFAKLNFKKILYLFAPREYVHDVEYNYIKSKIGIFKFLFMDLRFIMPFVILGFILGLRKWRQYWLLYVFIISVSLSIAAFFVTARYKIVFVPFLMIFASYGAYSIWEAAREKRLLKWGVLVSVVSILMGLSCYSYNLPALVWNSSKINSSLFDYHLLRAAVYAENKLFNDAVSEIWIAKGIEPENSRADFRLAILYFRMNDLTNAEKMFKEVIKKNPYSVDSFYNLGYIFNQKMRFKEAKEMLERAISLDPDEAKAHFELALSYKALGEKEKARQEFLLSKEKLNPWRTVDLEVLEEELKNLDNEK